MAPHRFCPKLFHMCSRASGRWLAACGVVLALAVSGCAAPDDPPEQAADGALKEDEFVVQTLVNRFESKSSSTTGASYWKVLLVQEKGSNREPFAVLTAYSENEKQLYEVAVLTTEDPEKPTLVFRDVAGEPLTLDVKKTSAGDRRILNVQSREVELAAVAADWEAIERKMEQKCNLQVTMLIGSAALTVLAVASTLYNCAGPGLVTLGATCAGSVSSLAFFAGSTKWAYDNRQEECGGEYTALP